MPQCQTKGYDYKPRMATISSTEKVSFLSFLDVQLGYKRDITMGSNLIRYNLQPLLQPALKNWKIKPALETSGR